MLRRSIDLKQPIGNWQDEQLVKAKRAIEYSIFAVIEAALRRMSSSARFLHEQLLEPLYERSANVTVASLNYDVIVDNAMFSLSEAKQNMRPPDYGVDIATERYANFTAHGTFGRLLKIHGSLNWLYCEKCQRLDLFVSRGMRTGKALDELYHSVPFNDAYSCRGTPCRNRPQCDGFVSPILISPTFVKDYENPHIKRVWDQAENAMKQCDRIVEIKIVARLRKHGDNKFVEPGKRLKELKERRKQGLLASIEYFKQLLKLAKQVLQAEKEVDTHQERAHGFVQRNAQYQNPRDGRAHRQRH